jgi:hypothetical protein
MILSIVEVLKQVFADHLTKGNQVFSCILETTQHPAAASSFDSIMFAPHGQLSFRDALSRWIVLKSKLPQIFLVPFFLFYFWFKLWICSSFLLVDVKWTMYQSASCMAKKTPGWIPFGAFRWNARYRKLRIMRSARLVTALVMKFLRRVACY